MKLLECQKEIELEMRKEKAYLELVEAQSNLKLAEIKKNEIAGSSSSVSDNNSNQREDILGNDQRNINQFKVMIDHFVKTR